MAKTERTNDHPPAFFLGKGEPYDSSARVVDRQGRPLTVWSAIRLCPIEWYSAMAGELWELSRRLAPMLLAESVLDRIRDTNRCTSGKQWVEVWIDTRGKYRLRVWRRGGR